MFFHSKVTEDQIVDLMKAFAQADKDGDGILTAEEYKTTFHEHGIFVDEDWVRTMMEKIDLDGDGNISLQGSEVGQYWSGPR